MGFPAYARKPSGDPNVDDETPQDHFLHPFALLSNAIEIYKVPVPPLRAVPDKFHTNVRRFLFHFLK